MNPLKYFHNLSRGGGRRFASEDNSATSVVAKVLEDRERGRIVTDEQVLAAHPELAEELKRELRTAAQIRQAMLAVRNMAAPETGEGQCTDRTHGADRTLPQIRGYPVVREIDRGGQAAVYEAIQETTQRKVAIKVMSGGPFVGSRHRVRFEREVSILAALDHPNIVSIIERGRTPDGSFYFIMPYIDGWTVDEYWATQLARNRNGLRDLVLLFSKVAMAVEDAHGRGIIHRDLKPSNIVVDRRGDPHILDFGLARSVEKEIDFARQSITTHGQIVGSLPWASPEQAAGQSNELGSSSDVYSLGVMFFQALTGEFPYSQKGPVDEVLLRIRTLKAPPPTTRGDVRPGVDGSLDAIVLKCLAKLPEHRYLSAGGLEADLKAWLAGTRIHATPRRRPRRWMVGAACVLATGLSIALFAWNAGQPLPAATFQLPTTQNSIGMKFVLIPSGSFIMGSPETETGRNPDEQERQVVIARSFYLSTTTVTESKYLRVMHGNTNDSKDDGTNLPIRNVTWAKAVEFCNRLSEDENTHYRLPTEAEWEYACRAHGHQAFPDPRHPESNLYYLANSGGMIHPVGRKSPNAWGLFDMQGNVYQWCNDVYNRDRANHNPPATGVAFHVIRGGSALCELAKCRAAARTAAPQSFQQPDLGFRVVRDP